MKKFLKALAAIVISILFLISSFLFLMNTTINNTLFSSKFFSKQMDTAVNPESIDQMVVDALTNIEDIMPVSEKDKEAIKNGEISPELDKVIDQYKASLQENIDTSWLSEDVPSFIKSSHAYFTGHSNSIEPVDITPIKASLINTFLEDRVTVQTIDNATELQSIIEDAEGFAGPLISDQTVNEQALEFVMSQPEIKGMKIQKDTAVDILKEIGNRKETGKSWGQLFVYTKTKLVEDQLGFHKMKDELDVTRLISILYNGDDNPVSQTRQVFLSARKDSSILVLLSLSFSFALLVLLAKRLKLFLFWLGGLLVTSASFSFVPALFKKDLNEMLSSYLTISDRNGNPITMLSDFVTGMTNGMIVYHVMISLIGMVTGIALLTIGFLLKNRGKKMKNIAVLKITTAVFAVLMPICMILFAIDLGKSIGNYSVTVNGAAQKETVSINSALDTTLNTTLFQEIEKGTR
ncbi:MAG: hypothetical protein BGN88_08200 [Clostridiales bacterium 43-6]|nr:MAG: hypothetical protein BGN88_08200 [Clostridiales bacterium 43-6]